MSAPTDRGSFLARVRRGQASTAQDGPTPSTSLPEDVLDPPVGEVLRTHYPAPLQPHVTGTTQPRPVPTAAAPAAAPDAAAQAAPIVGPTLQATAHDHEEGLLRPLAVQLGRDVLGAVRDLLPIIAVVTFFQAVILRQPLPNLGTIAAGAVMVVLGLALFIRGLELGLFPIGESMAHGFARKGSIIWLVLFAFALGFGTTVAEPALIAIAGEAARVASDAGTIAASEASRSSYAMGLRITVALSVGVAVVVGVIRIVKGWPVQYFIIGGYIGVLIMTLFAPDEIIGIAYDSGGVTTSTVTVPLVTALGVGLATSVRGRNPMIDGFGLIAFASLTPMVFVMGYGIVR